ncbi:hypothetical protein, partial [Leptospira idonii]|uniref:hypothetical protein n=1 Tax=Leptospira idonii TaxID=1193500 RepID=UPI001AF01FA4
ILLWTLQVLWNFVRYMIKGLLDFSVRIIVGTPFTPSRYIMSHNTVLLLKRTKHEKGNIYIILRQGQVGRGLPQADGSEAHPGLARSVFICFPIN